MSSERARQTFPGGTIKQSENRKRLESHEKRRGFICDDFPRAVGAYLGF